MRNGNFAVALDSTVEAIRELEYKRGLKAGAKMETPKIDKLLAAGWDLTVTKRNDGTFWATVHLARRNGPDSYHHMTTVSIAAAIAGLEIYIEQPEDGSAQRTK